MNNLNPLLYLQEFKVVNGIILDRDVEEYFLEKIYPKYNNKILTYIKKSFAVYSKKELLQKYGINVTKITYLDGCANLEIKAIDNKKNILRAQVEGKICYQYKSKEWGNNEDGMWFNSIILFDLNGWSKLEKIYLGS